MSGSLTMNLDEFGKVMGVGRGLIYKLAKRNELPIKVIRFGEKRMVVSRQDVMALLSGKQSETGTPKDS
ncbi:MAG TPA: hypothetical protein G4N93_06965 [Dehalococcoidia bacterium]|nr:hypothetical protein [Dehalococcoidia bacterium]